MTGGEGEMAEGEEHSMGSGSNSAAYMMLVNESDTPDALIRASTAAAETVELHTVVMEDGVMMMRPVTQIDVPASGETELRPGGFHVMLLGITDDLEEGETVDLTLTFENAGDVSISAPVQTGPTMDDMDDMDGGEGDMDNMEE
jgi:copper(I)-binding protein